MKKAEPAFAPLEYRDGYLPVADHGLIGDGETAALVGRDGAVVWLCVPRIDSPPLFCALLDVHKGGAFRIAPKAPFESRQHYLDDTAVLVTEMRAGPSLVRVTDALALRAGADLTEDAVASREELVRRVDVEGEPVELEVEVQPYGPARFEHAGEAIRIVREKQPDRSLFLYSDGPPSSLNGTFRLEPGRPVHFALSWSSSPGRRRPTPADVALQSTRHAWRAWMRGFRYSGLCEPAVRRSAITLKLMDNFRTAAIVAAPTSSLPEAIGGVRNWDYRYAWIRDASFAVYALARIGFTYEAAGFLAWVLDAFERSGDPKVLYCVDGSEGPPEVEDKELEGYCGSRPVRWGNNAAGQVQNDLYGEVLDCAYQWLGHHGHIDPPLWQRLVSLVDRARAEWKVPDRGIWEVRTEGRPFTYSAALCHVAIDRGVRLAQKLGYSADTDAWRRDAELIRHTIVEDAWNPKVRALTQHLGGSALDASLLALPVRRVIDARHPRMTATVEAICRELSPRKGLLYRYDPRQAPDGLPGDENAFVLCSFWLVDNLAEQGRLDEAAELYHSLCERAGPLGLLPEEIEPSTGKFMGNYPQALSHVGLVASGVRLGRLLAAAKQA